MDGILMIKTGMRAEMINLRNVKSISRKVDKDGIVELNIRYMDNCSSWYFGWEADLIWAVLQECFQKAKDFGVCPTVMEVNLCGSAEPAAGQVAGGAGGLTGEPGDVRCECGHLLRDHVGGMDCSLCSCELFEDEEGAR